MLNKPMALWSYITCILVAKWLVSANSTHASYIISIEVFHGLGEFYTVLK